MPQATGNITAVGQSVTLDTQGYPNGNFHYSGTFTGAQFSFEGSADGVYWIRVACQQSSSPSTQNHQTVPFNSTSPPPSAHGVLSSSYAYLRTTCLALATGSVDVVISATGTPASVGVSPPSAAAGGTDMVDAVQIQGETQLSFAIGTTGAQAGAGVAAAGIYDFSSDVDCFLKIAPAAGTASNVTTSNGEPLFAGNVVPHRLALNDRPGAITAAGSGTLRYIRVHP